MQKVLREPREVTPCNVAMERKRKRKMEIGEEKEKEKLSKGSVWAEFFFTWSSA
jgi:hypothetical protein